MEKPNIFESNMTFIAARDATFTSAPNSQQLPLTAENIVVQEFLAKPHPGTFVDPTLSTGTLCPVPCTL